jgi:hypothetical protein
MNQNVVNYALAILALSCFSPNSYAGREVGNGGNVVVCRDQARNIRSVELLDYYEARTIRGFTIDLGGGLTVDEKLADIFARLTRLSPVKAKRLNTTLENFSANAVFIPGITLVATPDSNHIIVPDGCVIEQVVIQKDPVFPEDHLFTVNKDLWDHLDPTTEAGLILHETFYHEALLNPKVTDSIAVRYFNAYMSSRESFNLTVPSYHQIENYIPFLTFEQNGVEFSNAILSQQGFVKDGTSLSVVPFEIPGQKPWLISHQAQYFYDDGNPRILSIEGNVEVQIGSSTWHVESDQNFPNIKPKVYLDPSGAVIGLDQVSGHYSVSQGQYNIEMRFSGDSIRIRFQSDGIIAAVSDLTVHEPALAGDVEIRGPGALSINAKDVSFDSSGDLRCATIGRDTRLKMSDGTQKYFRQYTSIAFDQGGIATGIVGSCLGGY